MRRAALSVALALTALAALLPASAAGHALVRPAGSVVSYLSADATSLNTLRVGVSGNRIEFRDETVDGGMDPGGCTPGDIDGNGYIISTTCQLGGVKRVRIDLGEREDSATVSLPIPATILGGPGADNLASGDANDELSGGEGNDLVNGGGGNDVISGDQGQDTLTGGAGSDRIASRDGEADSVSCGEGTDTVEADTLDQVSSDCESVSRSDTPGGGGTTDDGRPPKLQVGALTLQRLGRSRVVRVYATSSERGTVSASGGLTIGSLVLPVKTIDRKRIKVGGGGAVLTYRIRGRHWREARRALRRGRAVVLRLGVVATDLAGRSTERKAPAIRLMGGRGKPLSAGAVRARAAHPEAGDMDSDEVKDEVDNCLLVYNLDYDAAGNRRYQQDVDGDGPGTACDPDESVIGGSAQVDRKRPRVTVGIGRRQQMRAVRAGLIVKLRCSEACDSTGMLEVPRRTARQLGLRGGRVIASGSARLQGAGTTYVFVRFDRRVRRELFGMTSLRSSLTVVAVEPSGDRRRLTRRLLLVR